MGSAWSGLGAVVSFSHVCSALTLLLVRAGSRHSCGTLGLPLCPDPAIPWTEQGAAPPGQALGTLQHQESLERHKSISWSVQSTGYSSQAGLGLHPHPDTSHGTIPAWLHLQLHMQRENSIECLDSGFHFPPLSNQRLINSQCPSEVNISVSCINTYIYYV